MKKNIFKLFMVNGMIINVCTAIHNGQIHAKRNVHGSFFSSVLFCLVNPQFSTPRTEESPIRLSENSPFNTTAMMVCTRFFSFGLVFVFLCLFLSLPLSLMISFDDLWLSFKCFTVNVREFVNLCRSTWLYFDIVFHCYYGRYYCYCCCYASTYFVV